MTASTTPSSFLPLSKGENAEQSEASGGLYIHIPFCKKKCNYCDFVSYAGKEDLIDKYVDKLINEIQSSSPDPFSIKDGEGELLMAGSFPLESPLSTSLRGGQGVRTIYFGGGTPTLLSPQHFDKILNALITHYALRVTDYEISIEANPGTADMAKLKALRELGINRLSIGVQSFNDMRLKTLGRIHDSKAAKRFYHDARDAGFDNINLDLIFALPDQTLDEWKADLDAAIELKPEHLSTYNLQIEEGTPLWNEINSPPLSFGHLPLAKGEIIEGVRKLTWPNEELDAAMYEYTIETLTNAGYRHYEISNFAKPGFECRHNINYWEMGDWMGIGAGAHSQVNGRRWSNANCLEQYIFTPSSFPLPAGRQVPLTKGENAEQSEARGGKAETIFMGLRLLEGLSVDKFKGFEAELEKLINEGLLEREKNNIRLSKKGLFLGNLAFERFV